MDNYYITGSDNDGGQYSAHYGDYWNLADNEPMGALVKVSHPYVTVTGRIVYAERILRWDATMRDLRRLGLALSRMGE